MDKFTSIFARIVGMGNIKIKFLTFKDLKKLTRYFIKSTEAIVLVSAFRVINIFIKRGNYANTIETVRFDAIFLNVFVDMALLVALIYISLEGYEFATTFTSKKWAVLLFCLLSLLFFVALYMSLTYLGFIAEIFK